MPDATVPPTEPAAPRESVTGYVDGVSSEGRLDGWAVDMLAPHRAVEIRVLDGGRLVAIGSADIERLDVAQAGYGKGVCGFSLPLPDDMFDGQSHSIAVMVRTPGAPQRRLGVIEAVLPVRKPASALCQHTTNAPNWRRVMWSPAQSTLK